MGVWENPINWVGGVGGDKRGKFGSPWYDLEYMLTLKKKH